MKNPKLIACHETLHNKKVIFPYKFSLFLCGYLKFPTHSKKTLRMVMEIIVKTKTLSNSWNFYFYLMANAISLSRLWKGNWNTSFKTKEIASVLRWMTIQIFSMFPNHCTIFWVKDPKRNLVLDQIGRPIMAANDFEVNVIILTPLSIPRKHYK